ncbi:MAG: OpcA/G6PD domain-containing protein [Galbitalea sp.]
MARPARRGARPAALRNHHGRRGARRRGLAVDRAARGLAAGTAAGRGRAADDQSPRPGRAVSRGCGCTGHPGSSNSSGPSRTSRPSSSPTSRRTTSRFPRRSLRDCLAEELRRLDPDVLFGEVIRNGVEQLGSLVDNGAAGKGKGKASK